MSGRYRKPCADVGCRVDADCLRSGEVRKLLAVGLLAGGAATPLAAEEVTVQNDSVVDFSRVTIQAGFDPGESAAAWLISPCEGNIVAVQVFWRSLRGGALPSLEHSITIFSGGLFPVPGPVLNNGIAPFQPAILEGPVMTDGVLNESSDRRVREKK